MTIKKSIFVLFFTVIVVFATVAQSIDRTVDNTHYEYDESLKTTGDKSTVLVESNEIKPGTIASVHLYKQYNQAIFRIDTLYSIRTYDEADVETTFKNFIEDWITSKSHRYYSYQIQRKKTFFNKTNDDGERIVRTEYKVILYTN